MKCSGCQREVQVPIGPLRCGCGAVTELDGTPRTKAVCVSNCIHRTPRIGSGSCGCGSFHRCNFHNVYCSDRRPTEELYTITLNLDNGGGSLQLSNDTYRCCSGCEDFDSGDGSAVRSNTTNGTQQPANQEKGDNKDGRS